MPIIIGLVGSVLATGPANSQALSSPEALSPAETKAIAADAYLYAYPMLYNYKTLFQQTRDPSFPGYIGGFNRYRHYSRGFTPADNDIVTPSNDTPVLLGVARSACGAHGGVGAGVTEPLLRAAMVRSLHA